MAKTKLVAITAHVPQWVREAFRRCAKRDGITVSKLAALILIEDRQGDPENPENQAGGATLFVTSTSKRKPPPAAPPGAQPDFRPRHQQRPVEDMPSDEEV
jgi:hypothetical protein